jgi:pyrroline-5-carboxylate reductase
MMFPALNMSAIKSLWIVGAGKMGQALYRGWVSAGIAIDAITLIDPTSKPADVELRPTDIWLNAPSTHASKPNIILFAVKPQSMPDTVTAYRTFLQPETLVLSIAAGIATATMQKLCDDNNQPIVRLMPNTPAMIGQGITAGFANAFVSEMQRQIVEKLFQAAGQFLWLDDEQNMHAVTAVSGSGPAYVFALIEALTAAGITHGLSSAIAEQLARQTVIGSAALAAAQADISPAQLRQNVTSPNGTTAAGLAILQAEKGLDDLIRQTVAAATQRSVDLSS